MKKSIGVVLTRHLRGCTFSIKTKKMKALIAVVIVLAIVIPARSQWSDKIQVVLDNTTPLQYERGNRLPLYLWPAVNPGNLDAAAAEQLVKEFDKRGIGIVSAWNAGDTEKSLSQSLILARAQKKLGQRVNIEATSLLNAFFNGDERTAHIDQNGKPFFDTSFGKHKMGCPFAIDFRKQEIRQRVEFFVSKFKEAGLPIDYVFTDWEIDGPLETNHAFETSKMCVRCRKYLGDAVSYTEFQNAMRQMRSYLQNYSYSAPVLSEFPNALVGNYGVYPNDGFRYWYDYFEYYADGQPYKADQKAKYRQWANDYPATGFTFAMPVIYPWDQIYSWYNFESSDYRWFYNMLLVASNAGKSTPQNIPIISFVHWNTVAVSHQPDPSIKQMSKESYQELLWHMLLRGTDTFFMWGMKNEFPEEVRLVHQVYAAAQQYGDFLDHGLPITYDVPNRPGTVISGLALRDSVLIRRTDFGTDHKPVEIMAGTKAITVDYAPGVCRIYKLK